MEPFDPNAFWSNSFKERIVLHGVDPKMLEVVTQTAVDTIKQMEAVLAEFERRAVASEAAREKAVSEERERCARIAKEHWMSLMSTEPNPIVFGGQRAAREIEKKIRASAEREKDES